MSLTCFLHGSRRLATQIFGLAAFALLVLNPGASDAQMRPLVRSMLDNLSDLERISEGLALEDWDRIEEAARDLRTRARAMSLLDLETLYMERSQDAAWDAFLLAQEAVSREISRAALDEDAKAVLASTKKLIGGACLSCHSVFRDPQSRLRESVLIMTSFLSASRDIKRGMMVRDFKLIATRGRELAALSEVIGTDKSLEDNFGLGGPGQRRRFREFLTVITASATSIADAAEKQELPAILESFDTMWSGGCVSCHAKFRR